MIHNPKEIERIRKRKYMEALRRKKEADRRRSRVLPLEDERSYYIILREGGYMKVEDCVVTEIVEDRELRLHLDAFKLPTFDKWGYRITSNGDLKDHFDIHGGDYYF